MRLARENIDASYHQRFTLTALATQAGLSVPHFCTEFRRHFGVPPVTYLIGRRSDKRGVFPEISLDADDAVSHRHALLNRTPDGGIVVRDVGSSNGTRLNGVEVEPLTDTVLKDGDVITIGHWTRLAIRRVA